MAPEERLSVFFRAIEKLAGKTHHAASPAEVAAYIATLIEGKQGVASNAPVLRECGVTALAGIRTDFADREELRAACTSADFGITGADYALADTGSLVMLSSRREARMVSLLPPMHIAVVPREAILTGLDELYTVLPNPAAVTSSMVFITGPSRTADIEQILVRGVHGPGEIHVIVVDRG
jgi:L-lactate dehydrogenase complex protein LldG